jgi:hypothetical protein
MDDNPRALYQAVANAIKEHGELSPEEGLALVDLWEYFNATKDHHSAGNCLRRLGEIVIGNPLAAKVFPDGFPQKISEAEPDTDTKSVFENPQ